MIILLTKKIEKKISSKTKAIIVTQLNGRIANMEVILKIANKYKLKVFEDSAQALGAYYRIIILELLVTEDASVLPAKI